MGQIGHRRGDIGEKHQAGTRSPGRGCGGRPAADGAGHDHQPRKRTRGADHPARQLDAHHTWTAQSCSVDGRLTGGGRSDAELDVATTMDPDVAAHTVPARDLCLRGHVLAVCTRDLGGGSAPPMLVVPVSGANDLTPGLVREAIYRYLRGHTTELTLDS